VVAKGQTHAGRNRPAQSKILKTTALRFYRIHFKRSASVAGLGIRAASVQFGVRHKSEASQALDANPIL
jgi:hypothetical protein